MTIIDRNLQNDETKLVKHAISYLKQRKKKIKINQIYEIPITYNKSNQKHTLHNNFLSGSNYSCVWKFKKSIGITFF